ncbi:MAG: hypothetical protein F4220_14270 [Gammaproteobacteria bacterium]|nr:hypothetical protein [Gammaproteobacteria bacterium]
MLSRHRYLIPRPALQVRQVAPGGRGARFGQQPEQLGDHEGPSHDDVGVGEFVAEQVGVVRQVAVGCGKAGFGAQPGVGHHAGDALFRGA